MGTIVPTKGTMQITTKSEFFDLWNKGVLGFKLRTWETPEDAVAAGVPLVGFRQLGVAGGGKFEMTDLAGIHATASRWRSAGLRFMICEAAPDDKGTIQGEVCRGLRGWEGFLGPVVGGRRMRQSIADGHITARTSAETRFLLRTYLSPASLDDLDALLDLYPDATVELTAYGDHDFERGRNTIFWEVRNY